MNTITIPKMRKYLSKSITSLNRNKINGLLAEIDFRRKMQSLGYQSKVSIGGWIARSKGMNNFSHSVIVIFPEIIDERTDYAPTRPLPTPALGLHTICATFHQIGIQSYYCVPTINKANDPMSIKWKSIQLGLPTQEPYESFPESISGHINRNRQYNFLRYHTDVSRIPEEAIQEEFTKEKIRVDFCSKYMSEVSDVDGIFWGETYTYPLEIKEKTVATDRGMGNYFGIDVGPFVKLAFYAAKKGNLRSIFIVREINNVEERGLINWWFITYEKMAQYASWVSIGGGRSMGGGASSTIKIPKAEFLELNDANLSKL